MINIRGYEIVGQHIVYLTPIMEDPYAKNNFFFEIALSGMKPLYFREKTREKAEELRDKAIADIKTSLQVI